MNREKRDTMIAEMRDRGSTLKEISDVVGLSKERVRAINTSIKRGKRTGKPRTSMTVRELLSDRARKNRLNKIQSPLV
jgi:DNA-directed RNA polymerase sigma subunit (sigma70/sigma32)